MADDIVLPIPNLNLPQQFFVLSTPSLAHLHQDARQELLKGIQADSMCSGTPPTDSIHSHRALLCSDMTAYYRIVTSTGALTPDESLLEKMENVNKEALDKLDQRLAEAEKTEGESEISDALRAKANYFTRIGDKVKCLTLLNRLISQYLTDAIQDGAVEAQKLALQKTPGLGTRIDIVLTIVRIGFFFGDNDLIAAQLKQAEK
jgi:26S proteasome regulatory subunit N7